MKKYVVLECGNSAYTEFKMNNGDFEQTDDGIFLGIVSADNSDIAKEKIKELKENKNRIFDNLIVYEVNK